MRAVALADQAIRAGDRQVILAGGMESMSNAPYLLAQGALRLPLRRRHADRLDARGRACAIPGAASRCTSRRARSPTELGIHRADLDRWALRSHERAIAAIDAGRFADEIVPVEVSERRTTALVELDEGPRRDTSLEALAALRPLVPEHPTHTAGNSPGRHRRRCGAGRRRRGVGRRAGADAARAHPRRRGDREPPRLAGARPRARRDGSRSSAPGSQSPRSTASRSTRPSPPSRSSRARTSAPTPSASTSTAARSRSGTRRRLGRTPARHAAAPAARARAAASAWLRSARAAVRATRWCSRCFRPRA